MNAPAVRPRAPSTLLGQLLAELGVPDHDLDERRLMSAVETLAHLIRGYREAPEEVVAGDFFEPGGDEPVTVRDIGFVSMCREHCLPFRGKAHVAYLPGEAVVGLSRLESLVHLFARRLQTPTRLAEDVAAAIESTLGARGVAVRVEARHRCPGASGTVDASAYLGEFRLPLWRERLRSME